MADTTPTTGTTAAVLEQIAERYPRQVALAEHDPVQLWLMREQDIDAVLAFAKIAYRNSLRFYPILGASSQPWCGDAVGVQWKRV